MTRADGMPHGGWSADAAFEQSQFCARCHQFDADGFALDGKLLENTYGEWSASRHAREGRACQSCHMPDRRHLWRGIHDARMTLAAISIEAIEPRIDVDGRIAAGWRITNSGAGHFFPTYVTPRIIATIRQETAAGQAVSGTAREFVIAREVRPDLSAEVFDTRIAPDESRELRYTMKRSPSAAMLTLEIRVEPDAFYTGLYRSLLAPGGTGSDRSLIAEALRQSIASQYVLYTGRQPLR